MEVNKESEKPEALKILRILLIEDNEHDVLAFRRAFKKDAVACEITSCSRAEEGLQRYYTEPLSFDLIVIDQGLPGISGFEMCRKLLREGISIPIVILTGMGSTELAVKALKAGVNDYIIKDPDRGYIDLLPTVLSEVMKRHNERLSYKKAEEKILLHSEILKNMAEGVCLIRASDSVIVYANEKFEKMFGYGPGELNQKPVTVFNYEDKNIDAEQVRDDINKQLYSPNRFSSLGAVNAVKNSSAER